MSPAEGQTDDSVGPGYQDKAAWCSSESSNPVGHGDEKNPLCTSSEAELFDSWIEHPLLQAMVDGIPDPLLAIDHPPLLQTVIDGIPDPLLVIDRQYRVVLANQTIRKMAHLKGLTTKPLRCYHVSHNRKEPCCDDHNHRCPLKEVLVSKSAVSVQHIHYDDKGEKVVVNINAAPILDQHGEIVLIIETCRDITTKVQVEEALRESERKYRKLFEQSNDAIIIYDLEGQILDVNDSTCAMLGDNKQHLIALPITALHVERSLPEVVDAFRAVHEHGSARFESQLRRMNGTVLAVDISSRVVDQSRGIIQGIIRDITERIRSEESLRSSERRYRLLAENASDVIWTLDLGLHFTYLSPSVERLRGYNASETRAQGLEKTLTPRSFTAALRAIAGEMIHADRFGADPGRSCTLELAVIRRDGSTVITETTMTLLLDGSGLVEGVLGVMRDISERKLKEEERERLEEKLRQSQKLEAIGKLAGGLAHDMNNILATIGIIASILETNIDPGHPLAEHVEGLRLACRRGHDLTQNLLSFAHKQDCRRETISINQLVLEVTELLQRTISKKIEILPRLDPTEPAFEGDAGLVHNAIINLAVNAADAMNGDGLLTLETSTTFLDHQDLQGHSDLSVGPFVTLKVKDTGIGMDDATLEQAFEPFFTTKPIGEGTGLGLSLVYGAVKKHGGLISINSKPGRGTKVTLHLPASTAQPQNVRRLQPRLVLRGGDETILLVDDDDLVRENYSKLLQELGYTVITASNGAQAVKIYREQKEHIALVILDLIMPVMDGEETYKALCDINPEVTVVLCSGYTPAAAENLLVQGVAGLIRKPFELEELSECIANVLE